MLFSWFPFHTGWLLLFVFIVGSGIHCSGSGSSHWDRRPISVHQKYLKNTLTFPFCLFPGGGVANAGCCLFIFPCPLPFVPFSHTHTQVDCWLAPGKSAVVVPVSVHQIFLTKILYSLAIIVPVSVHQKCLKNTLTFSFCLFPHHRWVGERRLLVVVYLFSPVITLFRLCPFPMQVDCWLVPGSRLAPGKSAVVVPVSAHQIFLTKILYSLLPGGIGTLSLVFVCVLANTLKS